jgi:hypothetical protein
VEPPWVPVEDAEPQSKKTLSVASRLSTATRQVEREPSVDPYWNEMRIVRLVASLMAVVLTVVAIVLAMQALPFGWIWLPPTLALIPYFGFALWAWNAQHEADMSARLHAAAMKDRQFRIEQAQDSGRVEWG